MADVTLNITVPDVWATKVLDAFNIITNTNLTIEAMKNELNGHWNFSIDPKNGAENNKQFGERVLRELGKAIVNMVDKAEDEIRYRNAISAITPPASNVPDDVLI